MEAQVFHILHPSDRSFPASGAGCRVPAPTAAVAHSQAEPEQFGQTYFKPPDGLLPGASTNLPASFLKDRSITGDAGLFGRQQTVFMEPWRLANVLQNALAKTDTADFPATGDSGTPVGGTNALKVTTPSGELYVTEQAPYRVLRWVPGGGGNRAPPSLPAFPDMPSLPPLPSFPSFPDFPSFPAQPGTPDRAAMGLSAGANVVPAGFERAAPAPAPSCWSGKTAGGTIVGWSLMCLVTGGRV